MTRPKPKTKDTVKAGEYAMFESSLKKVLTVSHEEMQKRIKNASSARASKSKP